MGRGLRDHLNPPEHQRSIKTCWACNRDGTPCCKPSANPEKRAEKSASGNLLYVPYCTRHLRVGDEAVEHFEHPTKPYVGNILVARKALPVGYRLVYWGERKRCTFSLMDQDDRIIDFYYGQKQQGALDPGPYRGCVMQFAASPGPEEWATVAVTSTHFGAMDSQIVGRMYVVVRPIPKGGQLAHHYGGQWFRDREIDPVNVGTSKHPLPPRIAMPGLLESGTGRIVVKVKKGSHYVSLGTFDCQEEAVAVLRAFRGGGGTPGKVAAKSGSDGKPRKGSAKAKKEDRKACEEIGRGSCVNFI
mmetsp:Transcript_70712/g.188577  ORF Transcript_70712/g.188577 Transcript_70712/m.188577 type:complete len:302 (+) Transcript_70712:637-1542(+)